MVSVTRKEKLDKLDNAFLFIISVLGLLVTIIQTYLSGTQGLIEALPLLVLGIPIPFYIGYIRGAISISQDDKQIVERLRGWGYLVVGIGGYLSLEWENPLIYFAVLLLSVFSVYYVQQWFMKIFEMEENLSHEYSVYGSTVSAFLLAFISRLSVKWYLNQSPFPLVSFNTLMSIYVIIGAIMIGLIFEKASRMIMDAPLRLDDKQFQKRMKGNFLSRYVSGLWDLGNIIIRTDTKATKIWLSGWLFALPAVVITQPTLLADKPWLILFATVFISTSMVLALIGTIRFLKTKSLDVSNLWAL